MRLPRMVPGVLRAVGGVSQWHISHFLPPGHLRLLRAPFTAPTSCSADHTQPLSTLTHTNPSLREPRGWPRLPHENSFHKSRCTETKSPGPEPLQALQWQPVRCWVSQEGWGDAEGAGGWERGRAGSPVWSESPTTNPKALSTVTFPACSWLYLPPRGLSSPVSHAYSPPKLQGAALIGSLSQAPKLRKWGLTTGRGLTKHAQMWPGRPYGHREQPRERVYEETGCLKASGLKFCAGMSM